MTDRDLATLVREHVRRDEPAFLLSAETSIALGRRTLRRRRVRRSAGVLVAAAAAVAALPLVPWTGSGGSDDRTGIDPATAAALRSYDPQRMPKLIDEHARAALGAGLDGLGDGAFRADDDQGVKLPAQYYDKASAMSVSYGGHGDARQVVVSLLHSRGEAEGDARRLCESQLATGYAFSCAVTTGRDGDPITTSVTAVRAEGSLPDSWAALTRQELRTGVPTATDPNQDPIEPSQVYFMRTVESVHSETFLTIAKEIVRAPGFEQAQQAFQVPVDALAEVVNDPELTIPRPPMGKNGCTWMLHPEGVSCTTKKP